MRTTFKNHLFVLLGHFHHHIFFHSLFHPVLTFIPFSFIYFHFLIRDTSFSVYQINGLLTCAKLYLHSPPPLFIILFFFFFLSPGQTKHTHVLRPPIIIVSHCRQFTARPWWVYIDLIWAFFQSTVFFSFFPVCYCCCRPRCVVVGLAGITILFYAFVSADRHPSFFFLVHKYQYIP